MAGAPEDGNPGRERGEEARRRAEARALASLLRGSGPRYPFPVEEIEEHPSEPDLPVVVRHAEEPPRPAQSEPETEAAPQPPPLAPRRRRAGRLVGVALVLLFLLLAAIAGLGAWELARSRVRADRLADELERARAELGAIRDDLRDLRADVRAFAEELPPDVPALLQRVEPSVTAIRLRGKVVVSGVVVEGPALPKGYRTAILTRSWVAGAAARGPMVVVTADGRSFRVRPSKKDRQNGLSLLFIKGALPSLPWATEDPTVGEFAAGVGLTGPQVTGTVGVITAVGPQVVRTDARLIPGAAGGPVVNRDGEVVAIARAGDDGLVTAIPIDRACRKLLPC